MKFIFEKNLITIANIRNANGRYRYHRSSTGKVEKKRTKVSLLVLLWHLIDKVNFFYLNVLCELSLIYFDTVHIHIAI